MLLLSRRAFRSSAILLLVLAGVTGGALFTNTNAFVAIYSRLNREDLTLSPLTEEHPLTVNEDEYTRIPFRLMNHSGSEVHLVPRNSGYARIEGLPGCIPAGRSVEFDMLIDAVGMNGHHTFSTLISTDNKNTPHITVSAHVFVHADEARKIARVFPVPTNCSYFRRNTLLEDLPSDTLLRVGQPIDTRFSITCADAGNRNIRIEIKGKAQVLDDRTESISVHFDLFFRSPEIRRVRVQLVVPYMAEWAFPPLISLNPISAPSRRTEATIAHRVCKESIHSSIRIVSWTPEYINVGLEKAATLSLEGFREDTYVLIVWLRKEKVADGKGAVCVAINKGSGWSNVWIPVNVSGYRS